MHEVFSEVIALKNFNPPQTAQLTVLWILKRFGFA